MIRLEGLTKRYGSFTAVDGIDLEIPKGALFGFLGPNGAGKTTTIKMIAGLLIPTEGQVRVCELPYVAPPRRSGESKTGSTLGAYLRRGRKYILTVLRLRFLGTGQPTNRSASR